MAKIPLRAYNREIETLIEQGHIDEAIAHCRHILKTFPKCLDTYRLLGKAYLEGHRFAEADDILKRLLLAVPDDFIGNLGMSIIFDEQKNINNAIWHMERAFEVQPSNTAVQGELRRLYGRRDGLEPPQIRLTRGALAQMYARGNQIQQAIAEIRAMLAEDADRMDLEVLLARVYFRGGQKVEATDTCTALLKKYPYCLDANRIMVGILTDTSRSDSTQIYRHRVNALDPYSAFVTASLFDAAEVPDAALAVEKLDFEADQFSSPADLGFDTLAKTALGLSLSSEEAQPAGQEGSVAQPSTGLPGAGQAEAAPAEEIPDWLKAAGWGATTAEVVRRAELAGHDENGGLEAGDQAADDLAQGEMPEWLKSMAPPDATQSTELGSQTQELESVEPDTDWLAGLGAPEKTSTDSGADVTRVGMGLTGAVVAAAAAAMMGEKEQEGESPVDEAGVEQVATAPESDVFATEGEAPEWPAETTVGGSVAAAATEPEELPDWLTASSGEPEQPDSGLDSGDLATLGAVAAGVAMAANRQEEEPAGEPVPAEEPETLGEQPPADVSAWLAGLDQQDAGKSEEGAGVENEALVAAAAFEFGRADESSPETPVADSSSAPQMTEDDAIAGLESLSAEQGANPDELLTTPEDITEVAPEQLSQSEAGQPEAEPAEDAIFPEEVEPMADTSISQPTEEEPAPAAEGTTEAPQAAETAAQMKEDDAFAWLESLAAKQGANPDELLTRPEDRGETPPEWLSQPESPAFGETIAAAATAAAVGAMLSKDEEPDKPAAEPTPPATAEPAAEGLEWLEGIEQEGVAEQTQAQPAVASEWLPVEPLAEEAAGGEVEPGAEETTWESIPSFTAEIARDATAPEAPSSATEEMPDWLRTSLEETPAAPEAQELPEWMAATGEVPAQAATALPEAVGQEPEPASSEMLTGSSENERFAAEPETVSGIQIARPTPPEGDDAIFEQAQVDLQRGQLDQAVKGYSRLIKKGKLLDEIIYDLRDGTYRYPVDVMIWLTLGDAYKRANRLQEALDAYTKAEGLLR